VLNAKPLSVATDYARRLSGTSQKEAVNSQPSSSVFGKYAPPHDYPPFFEMHKNGLSGGLHPAVRKYLCECFKAHGLLKNVVN
jgi:hypothetical protein